jgi:small subunit ribosomal protein S17
MAEKKQNKQEKSTKKDAQHLVTPVPTRGRVFEGTVTKKFAKRVVIESERTVFVPKYERFYKKKMRIHARIPDGFVVEVGDYIRVQECRPLSKIIHAVVIELVRKAPVIVKVEETTK